jgi:hypothetical protein
MKFKLQLSGLILILSLLSSCLRVETGINLKKDGSVSVTLEYTLSGEIADFGRGFGSDEPWFLPLTEKDFIQQTLRHPGVKLKSYKDSTSSAGDETIKVELESGSMEELAAFLDLDMTVEERDGGGTFTLTIPSFPPAPEGSEGIDGLVEKAAENSSFLFSFDPPKSIRTSTPGTIKKGEAVFEILLIDVLSVKTPAVWTVTW